MSKTHISIKKIRNYWSKKFYCGYCDLQDIMKYKEPTYYNAGVYGWNCDIYTDAMTDIAITTGYRNMTGKRIPNELIKKYSDNAKEIWESMAHTIPFPYEAIKDALDQNRRNFFDELNNI